MIRRATLDLVNRTMQIEMAGGTTETAPIPADIGLPSSVITATSLDFRDWSYTLTTPTGDVRAELGWPGVRDALPVGRPVVYLDQCHWSSVGRAGSARISSSERLAALRLAELARQRRIVLPISSAHVLETDPLYGKRRAEIASRMTELCGGWQMRTPINIRRRELRASMAGQEPRADDVFTLAPNTIFASQGLEERAARDQVSETVQRLSWIAALYETLLGGEVPMTAEGQAKLAKWAELYGNLRPLMRERSKGSAAARSLPREAILTDLREECTMAARASGISQQELDQWTQERLDSGFAGYPYLARWERVLYLRLRNHGDRWEPNDLSDFNFLLSAAGYADVVVSESKMCGYLRQAEGSIPAGAAVFPKLAEAIEPIEALVRERGAKSRAA